MGNYSDAQRAKMPASAFCGPDRSFPVLDAEDAKKALRALGRAAESTRAGIHACVMGRAQRHGWKVSADMAAFDAAFSADPLGEGEDWVLRTGPVFECGDYPDKAFALTPEEADAAIAAFAPVPADYAHVPGPFDGQLGQLLTVWRDGATLFGTAAVPRWADTLLAQAGHKISLAWDRATKQIVGWAWVTDPRVSHAQLAAAFAAQHNPKETQRMSWMEELRALFARADAPVQLVAPPAPISEEPTAVPVPPTPAGPDPTVQFAAQQRELAEAQARLDAEKVTFAREKYLIQAERDIDALIREGIVVPAQDQPNAEGQRTMVAFGATILHDDATTTALFGQQGGSRYQAWLAMLRAGGPRVALTENLPVVTLNTGPDKAPADLDARRKELLAASPLGQRTLAMQKES